jgi:ribosome maturation factor RimP
MLKPPLVKKIEKTINPVAEDMGFEIVRVLLIGSGKPTLQIMAERPETGKITIDECGKLSQAISAVLDVEGTMGDTAYYLEVSSPGIDRPLTRLKDFERYKGQQIKVEIEPAIEGRKRFKGTLNGVVSGHVQMTSEEGGDVEMPFDWIQKAKLVTEDTFVKQKPTKKRN